MKLQSKLMQGAQTHLHQILFGDTHSSQPSHTAALLWGFPVKSWAKQCLGQQGQSTICSLLKHCDKQAVQVVTASWGEEREQKVSFRTTLKCLQLTALTAFETVRISTVRSPQVCFQVNMGRTTS